MLMLSQYNKLNLKNCMDQHLCSSGCVNEISHSLEVNSGRHFQHVTGQEIVNHGKLKVYKS